MKKIAMAAVVAAALASGQSWGDDASWKISTGLDYSSGKYGSDAKTKLTYLPVSLTRTAGAWKTKVSTGWIQNEGPGSVVGGGEGGVVIPGVFPITKESGIADTWVSLTREVQSFPMEYGYLDLTGKIKLPTGDDQKGLSTGEVDYTLQADYAYSMGAWTPVATVAYKIKGDPEGFQLNNVLYLSAGFDYKVSEQSNFGLSLDYQEASTDLSDDSLEIFSYMSFKLQGGRVVTPYVYVGLSDGSPDMGGGFQYSYKF